VTIKPTAEQLLELLEQVAGLRLFLKDEEGRLLWSNQSFADDFEPATGQTTEAIADEDDAAVYRGGDAVALARGQSNSIEPLCDRYVHTWKQRIERDGTRLIVGGYIDCTDMVLRQEEGRAKLEYEAAHDHLTGLLNRGTFYALLENACSQRHPDFSLIYIDLNGFKQINDTQGHLAGDRILEAVSRQIKLAVRHGDAIARLGGDEFVVLLLGASSIEASVICDRVAEDIASVGRVTAAAGIASYQDGDCPDDILGRADQAMYQAKRDGVSCRAAIACASPVNRAKEIDQALKTGAIVPYYQPIAASRNRRIVGYELLARWIRDGGSVVSPGVFLPVIVESGWAPRLDWQMLRQGLAALENFQGQWLSINVSEQTLFDPDFGPRLASEIDYYFADPDQLRLEISESIAIRVGPSLQGPDAIGSLRSLAEADTQVGILVDDYGSAYAHLLAIMRLCREVPNVQAIKLVSDLVSGIDSDPAKITICKTTIELAHGLGLETIAEGVETEAELLTLRGLHCDYLQGYFLGRPLPLSEYQIEETHD